MQTAEQTSLDQTMEHIDSIIETSLRQIMERADSKIEAVQSSLKKYSFTKLCRCCLRLPCDCKDCETCGAPVKKTGRILDDPEFYEHPEPTHWESSEKVTTEASREFVKRSSLRLWQEAQGQTVQTSRSRSYETRRTSLPKLWKAQPGPNDRPHYARKQRWQTRSFESTVSLLSL